MMFDVRSVETQFYQQSSSDSVFSPNMATPKMLPTVDVLFLLFFTGIPSWELWFSFSPLVGYVFSFPGNGKHRFSSIFPWEVGVFEERWFLKSLHPEWLGSIIGGSFQGLPLFEWPKLRVRQNLKNVDEKHSSKHETVVILLKKHNIFETCESLFDFLLLGTWFRFFDVFVTGSRCGLLCIEGNCHLGISISTSAAHILVRKSFGHRHCSNEALPVRSTRTGGETATEKRNEFRTMVRFSVWYTANDVCWKVAVMSTCVVFQYTLKSMGKFDQRPFPSGNGHPKR